MDERLNDPVDELEISVRAWNVLHKLGIAYVGELVQWREHDLLQHEESSKTLVAELREAMRAMGLALGTELPDWQRPDGAAVVRPAERD
ncbi:DNA-directed RNA polymerase subunit alpha C-terminal domain-containing protein [Nannocystis bainbridge]|uniref:DNA-directed RNA polymerase subunit alpha C-terminal domain-containing protein n=1 Tax=Nannocystis bainbridge TaxID=2995303 RepID=A0ABT5DS25_9BACT|nr:DNA-directed RNA polymerase subunit alpha C-terminal domain-containing protein [Nannocystis bainbridge]MDC0716459.1 DNA-directed RNA polymerase subunit alpha C-terminal domain-containing protein [Nannocystis bainbridge]